MPRQNRVTPWGGMIATPERGTVMGNRGMLHDAAGRVRRAWQVRRWIVCELAFKGRRRRVMTPGRYTELFFLDEATALSAGHRPCAECRHARFLAFCDAWRAAHPDWHGSGRPTAKYIDDRLHAERVDPDGSRRASTGRPDDLPDGTFVMLPGRGEETYLVRGDVLLRWSPGGYADPIPRPADVSVTVLTPPSTVAAVRAGYVPSVHPSAER